MSDWEAKLDSLLSNPDAMSQVMNLAQSLSQEMGGNIEGGSTPPPPPPRQSGSIVDALGGLDPDLIARILPMLRQMNRRESSETSAFLYALRPFLRESRREKVDRAVQLARLIHLAKTFLTTQEG